MTAKDIARFWEKIDKFGSLPDPVKYPELKTRCWHWKASRMKAKGKLWYGQFWLNGSNPSAHRIAWIIANGPVVENLWVLHKCDNPLCVNPDHLFLGTCHDNEIDKVKKGRQASGDKNGARIYPDRVTRGSKHYRSVLSEQQVIQIKTLYEVNNMRPRHIASRLGITKSNVRNVVYGNCWGHLKLDLK